MKTFMSNPCGFERCMGWECERCNYFKPRLFYFIPVPRKIGEWLFNLEERMFFKKYIFEEQDIDWFEEEE